jgi:hypothetical protein
MIDRTIIVIGYEKIEVLPTGNYLAPNTNNGQCHKYNG